MQMIQKLKPQPNTIEIQMLARILEKKRDELADLLIDYLTIDELI